MRHVAIATSWVWVVVVVVVVDFYVYYYITTSKNITLSEYCREVTVQRVILLSALLFRIHGNWLGKIYVMKHLDVLHVPFQ